MNIDLLHGEIWYQFAYTIALLEKGNKLSEEDIKALSDKIHEIIVSRVELPVKPEIAEDFKLLKELAEGELLAYDIFPPKDDVQKMHKESWEEALKNVKKYFR